MAFIGEIRLFAGKVAPRNWKFCEGQPLPISQHPTLFEQLGITYGGDGRTTVGLPDLRGRVPIHSEDRAYTLGARGGSASVTLSSAQIPTHSHNIETRGSSSHSTADLKVSDSVANTSDPASAKSIAGSPNAFSKALSTKDTTTILKDCVIGIPSITENTGGSEAHSNIQPYLVINYIIFCPEE